jgi:hypothetical protein
MLVLRVVDSRDYRPGPRVTSLNPVESTTKQPKCNCERAEACFSLDTLFQTVIPVADTEMASGSKNLNDVERVAACGAAAPCAVRESP